jgi:hypothetical protein
LCKYFGLRLCDLLEASRIAASASSMRLDASSGVDGVSWGVVESVEEGDGGDGGDGGAVEEDPVDDAGDGGPDGGDGGLDGGDGGSDGGDGVSEGGDGVSDDGDDDSDGGDGGSDGDGVFGLTRLGDGGGEDERAGAGVEDDAELDLNLGELLTGWREEDGDVLEVEPLRVRGGDGEVVMCSLASTELPCN